MNETIEQCRGFAFMDDEKWELCAWADVPPSVQIILRGNTFVNIGTFNTGEFRKFRRTGTSDPDVVWFTFADDAARECGMIDKYWAVYANHKRDRSGLGVQVNYDGTTKSHPPK